MRGSREIDRGRAGTVRPPRHTLTSVLIVGWVAAITVGMTDLADYSTRPGLESTPPELWPHDTSLQHSTAAWTLVLLAHPQCPCTHATIAELDRLVTRCGDDIEVHVAFLSPSVPPSAWRDTDLVRSARAIPGVSVHADIDGKLAIAFGAETSGAVRLYDPSGKLAFHGGITVSRGHEGANRGSEAIASLVRGRRADRHTPVFGCELFDVDGMEESR